MKKKILIDNLLKIVNKNCIISNNDDLSKYNKDWRGFYNNKSLCVIFPKTTKQVSKILKFCHKKNIKVVPQSGNTSLTGAAVPSKNYFEIIVNLNKMNKILLIDQENMLINVESGVILDRLKTVVDEKNLYFLPQIFSPY